MLWDYALRLSQTQFKEIFDCHEEVLECHGCTAKQALQEELLVGFQAAGDTVLLGTTAATGRAAVTAVLLRARDVEVQQPFTSKSFLSQT